MADNLRKYKSLYSSTANSFGTGTGVTITPNSVTGLPTDTEITLTFDRVNSGGTATPSSIERIIGAISGGNLVVRTSPSSGRGADNTTEQAHTAPVVEMIWNAKDWNDMVDWALVEHNQDGTHKAALVTTLKATGAEVNTGTEDAKIVTPKALADSAFKQSIDEDNMASDLDTKVPTQQSVKAYVDTDTGWRPANETWTYASASTFTVSGDQTAKYRKGTRLKFTQTTVKYAVVQSSSYSAPNTTVTIFINTDYTIANAPISANYYSYQSSPQGYPDWFPLATTGYTWNGIDDGSGGAPTITNFRYKVDNSQITVHFRGNGTKANTNNQIWLTIAHLPPPVNTAVLTALGTAYGYINSTDYPDAQLVYNTNVNTNVWSWIWKSSLTDNWVVNVFGATWTYEF